MNTINLQTYREKKEKSVKNQTWLYSISYDELFSEFINTFNRFEVDPQCEEIHAWLDQISDALNERFYNRKTT
jgi:hypothetical protein